MDEPQHNGKHGLSYPTIVALVNIAALLVSVYMISKTIDRLEASISQSVASQAKWFDDRQREHKDIAGTMEGVIYMLSLDTASRPGIIKPDKIRELELRNDTNVVQGDERATGRRDNREREYRRRWR